MDTTNTTTQYSAERPAGQEHIPIYPRGFIGLRIAQSVLGVTTLGLSAFIVATIPFDGAALMLFVAIATIITSIWHLVSHYSAPALYNYWAVLALDIFLVFFWLISFAILADRTAWVFNIFSNNCSFGVCYQPAGLDLALSSCMAAASALGGIQFALFITSLAIHGIALHRHRKAGLHCNPLNGAAPAIAPAVVSPQDLEKNAAVSAAAAPAAVPAEAYGTPAPQTQAPYNPDLNRAASPPAGYYPPVAQQPQPYSPHQQQTPPPASDPSYYQAVSPPGSVQPHEVPVQQAYPQQQ
ncbi:hypothetical protein SODALDRAFT_326426 [Sodiomyces alkalinus F11]|uniref:MARVEL domain-containing protein n=1 Tax=Sodiomyces alkalinus (strain CBS 110278 / VKM F-3762 / F11) TaxID=1314773 RepID=A0A3N2Q657_SODAK|nr:hypothetical protein SODALDRAFT_326426 [Sodiomyces alkalinus F11]ROT42242.1 hypothetical protein SODALDRAFT_326426 [Sodiomyces alkalinus F11]